MNAVGGMSRVLGTEGDHRVRIALLDGPVDCTHPCFVQANFSSLSTHVASPRANGLAFVHATHIASVIFGQPGSPVHGIAPRCHGLLGVIYSGGDTDNDSYICSQLDLARAILSAAEAGAHVINISGGQQSVSGEPSPLLAQAIQTCVERNILIVAAAGNNGCRCLHVPAAERSVLAVGAMDSSGYPLPFSNWGDLYQLNGILAPREKIFGAAPDGQTESKTGTSFATAIMTGVVGCLLSLQLRNGNEPDPHAVKAAILKTALPCPTAISDRRPFLVGRLNLFGVVNTV